MFRYSLPLLVAVVVLAAGARRQAPSSPGLVRTLRQVIQQAVQSPGMLGDIIADVAANPPPLPVNILSVAMNLLPSMDDNVSSVEILRKFGYKNVEVHHVYTEDGYRLRLERLPNPGGQPVLFGPGLQVASQAFVLLGRDRAPSTLMHSAGFDVWLLNYRGSHFSQKHRNLTTDDEAFWKFSFHEHGVYDNTAAIDYILRKTGFRSTMYVGHSMGSTSFLAMVAKRPEYRDKVLAGFLMGPVATMRYHESPVVGMLFALHNTTQPMLDRYKAHKTMKPLYLVLRRTAKTMCQWLPERCYSFISMLTGYRQDSKFMDLPFYWNTYPSGGSYYQVAHYVQNANREIEGFRMFDHGPERNLQLYGSTVPQEYDLTKVKTPLYLYLGHGDVLCRPKDVEYLKTKLPNAILRYAEDPIFNHIDFITGEEAHKQVYLPMIKDMQLLIKHQSARHHQ